MLKRLWVLNTLERWPLKQWQRWELTQPSGERTACGAEAETHFMAKGVPGAVVQARDRWASAATMATHYARKHQLIPGQSRNLPLLIWHWILGTLLLLLLLLLLLFLHVFYPETVSISKIHTHWGLKNRDPCWMLQILRDEG